MKQDARDHDNHPPPHGCLQPTRLPPIDELTWLVPFLKQTCSWSPMSAICVQNFDDSLSPAIHTRYRISLRSSSLREPRYPLLRVVLDLNRIPRLAQAARLRVTLNWPARSRPQRRGTCSASSVLKGLERASLRGRLGLRQPQGVTHPLNLPGA